MRSAKRGSRGRSARAFTPGSGLELLHVFVGQSNRADERFAFAQAVTVRAAGDGQVEFLRDSHVVLGGRRCVFGVKTFKAVEAGLYEVGDDPVGAVQAGMRHDGKPARLMD